MMGNKSGKPKMEDNNSQPKHGENELIRGAVHHLRGHLPPPLRNQLCQALDELRESDCQYSTLFNGKRNQMWTDIIDPELCLAWHTDPPAPSQSESESEPESDLETDGRPRLGLSSRDRRMGSLFDGLTGPGPEQLWQTAEAEADIDGRVQWRSWLNHLCPAQHAPLLAHLAALLGLALPQLEQLTKQDLRCRRLQVVVGAYEHQLTDDTQEQTRVSDWHIDGHERENIIATVTSYLEIGDGLSGGEVDFATQEDLSNEEPQEQHTECPESGSMLVFDNTGLRHRVRPISGRGRRLLVAIHLIDPNRPQVPSARSLPRQLNIQAKRDTLSELRFALHCKLPLVGAAMPLGIYEVIWSFVEFGMSPLELRTYRQASRIRRLNPGGSVRFRRGTGTYVAPSGPVLGGTGLAEHHPFDHRTFPERSDSDESDSDKFCQLLPDDEAFD